MPEQENKETMNTPTFEQVQQAFETFKGDYEIVHHPETPFANPFTPPNGPDHGHRQYSLTSIEGIEEEDFRERVGKAEVLLVGCMDKDGARPGYDELKKQYPDKNIMVITMAGGVVQDEGERTEALGTVLSFVGIHAGNLQIAILSGHNDKCGYVAYATDDALGKRGVKFFGSSAEKQEMKSLILNGVNAYRSSFREQVEVKPALLQIDRQTDTNEGGSAEFYYDFENVEPKSLKEL